MLGICHYNNGKYTLFNIKTAHKNKSPKNIIYLHLNFMWWNRCIFDSFEVNLCYISINRCFKFIKSSIASSTPTAVANFRIRSFFAFS